MKIPDAFFLILSRMVNWVTLTSNLEKMDSRRLSIWAVQNISD